MNFMKRAVDRVFNPKEYRDAGARGERLMYLELTGFFFGMFDKSQVIRNIYIKKRDGKFTEIDLLIVSRKGVIVIESKNYAGWIYGDGERPTWLQTLPTGMKNKFYNPIKQNRGHIRAVSEFLEDAGFLGVNYHSLIVFSEHCEFKGVTDIPEDIHLVKRGELSASIARIFKKQKDCLTKAQRDEIIRILTAHSRPDDDVKEQHISDVKEMLERHATTCPRCKSPLIEHKNKYTGKPFYGCTKYPKCRFTRKKTSS
ncbi:MAG: NERD domain-containing protein [Defluviitaleaceae bacterium]|nr:NERD domain-containing protein [Defluviitaleaceae bacterium]